MEYKQFDKYQGKKKKTHADLYEQFIDRDRAMSYETKKGKEHESKAPKVPRWTPEDQALEDILWAS